MNTPSISVIVPIYNVESYLEKCLDSIVTQSLDNFEVVLVNDGSTDSSGEIAQKYADEYSFVTLITQQNQGLGGARNTGIEHAAGDFFLFVDSDDYLLKDTLSSIYKKIIEENADMLIFGFTSVDINGNTLSEESQISFKGNSLRVCPEILLGAPAAWNKLIHRDLFLKTGIRFPPRVWYEDLRTTTKLYIYAKKIVYINQSFYRYLKRPGSIMNIDKADRISEIIDAVEDVFSYYREKNLFDAYKQEMEFIALNHIYYLGSLHVVALDRKHHLLKTFYSYMQDHFPNYMENKYLDRLGSKGMVILKMLNKNNYFALSSLLKLKRLGSQ